MVTRDCDQLLEHFCRDPSKKQKNLLYVISQSCKHHGEALGDGTMSTLILLDHLVRQILVRFPDVGSQNLEVHVERVRLLRALEGLINLLGHNEGEIRECFLHSMIYTTIEDAKSFALGVWTNLLVSATNRVLSQKIVSLLVSVCI